MKFSNELLNALLVFVIGAIKERRKEDPNADLYTDADMHAMAEGQIDATGQFLGGWTPKH
jgi:hypothetical protein